MRYNIHDVHITLEYDVMSNYYSRVWIASMHSY